MLARATIAGGVGFTCRRLSGPGGGGKDRRLCDRLSTGRGCHQPVGKRLYLIVDARTAIAYPVAVAKRGKEWSGPARIAGKFVAPAWSPPDLVKRDHPELPELIPGGSPSNPMGARAITLDRDEIAIHGTIRAMRASIGTAASYGCIRMLNEDVIDLFDRVAVGAPVMMMQ
jgi:lipoprotein-anchoring transpeptidase ErfK/SrfK